MKHDLTNADALPLALGPKVRRDAPAKSNDADWMPVAGKPHLQANAKGQYRTVPSQMCPDPDRSAKRPKKVVDVDELSYGFYEGLADLADLADLAEKIEQVRRAQQAECGIAPLLYGVDFAAGKSMAAMEVMMRQKHAAQLHDAMTVAVSKEEWKEVWERGSARYRKG